MNAVVECATGKPPSRTEALVPVDFAGRSCDMDPFLALAESNGLAVVEDCAHAIEIEHHSRKAGMHRDFGCFSFDVAKSVATSGDILC